MAKRNGLPKPTEVDAYVFIKRKLGELGWNTRNPERNDEGQVWTQNECLSNPHLKTCLGLDKPENVVKIAETSLWVIEAKRNHNQIDKALDEAQKYARKLNSAGGGGVDITFQLFLELLATKMMVISLKAKYGLIKNGIMYKSTASIRPVYCQRMSVGNLFKMILQTLMIHLSMKPFLSKQQNESMRLYMRVL